MLTMKRLVASPAAQRGTSLIEVLVTVVILSFGLLGIAVFQAKANLGSIESYQRAQAVILLEDMQARMRANPTKSTEYVTAGTTTLGTGDADTDCDGEAAGSARDRCEWSRALRGTSETTKDSKNAGAMEGARGCIEELEKTDPTDKICDTGMYRVTVAWQGLHETKEPLVTCGATKYGKSTLRRAISITVAIGVPECAST